MDSVKKIAGRIAHSGVLGLGLGLLGLYLSYKEYIPEYISYVSCYITCVGLYDLTLYFFEDKCTDSEDNRNKNNQSPQNMSDSLAFQGKPAPPRKISRQEFDKEVEKFLPVLTAESMDLPIKISLPVLELNNVNSLENPDLVSLLKEVKKDNITIRTSSIKMKILDNNNESIDNNGKQLLENAGDIIDQLRLRQSRHVTKFYETPLIYY